MLHNFFDFPLTSLPPETVELRGQVREFVGDYMQRNGGAHVDSWMIPSPEFSKLLGARGWLGVTWPKKYGGRAGSNLERFVIIEELLSAGAPVGAHWVADRQSGNVILKYGTEKQRQDILPRIAKGECYFAIGMSEPNSGSDLASIRTKATHTTKNGGGWLINGQKIWTSFAQHCHYVICLARTSPPSDNRHAGLSQFLVDLKTPGITIRPITNLKGEPHFNEIFFDDVFIPDDMVLGEVGAGWAQVLSELGFERSGPERVLSTYPLLVAAINVIIKEGKKDGEAVQNLIGELVARLINIRQMSISVAGSLDQGKIPALEASIVKDLGTTFEQDIPEILRSILDVAPNQRALNQLDKLMGEAILTSPSYSLRGGTREILHGIIARGLGVR